jgi:hypothetical protein
MSDRLIRAGLEGTDYADSVRRAEWYERNIAKAEELGQWKVAEELTDKWEKEELGQ